MVDPSPQPVRAASRLWLHAGVYAAFLGAGLVAAANEGGASWFGVEGPECPVGQHLGESVCPGCGLTRATAMVVQGDFLRGAGVHPAAPAVAVACAMAAVVLGHGAWRGGLGARHRWLMTFSNSALTSALVSGWLIRWGWMH